MATQLPHLPEIERLSARVIRILGGNPGKFTLQGTNTYLVGTGPRRLLIDTGEGKEPWLRALQKTLREENATISDTILTHWHHDHIGGIKQVKSIIPDARFHKNKHDSEQGIFKGDIRHELEDGQLFAVEGATLKAIHCPGHAVDHIALILQEENSMFTGDNVLGHGTAVFEDLGLYLKSLDKMRNVWVEDGYGQQGGKSYPGHGAVIDDGKGRILEYITHRQEREEEVLALLKSDRCKDGMEDVACADGSGEKGEKEWTPTEMVKIIYKELPNALVSSAEMGVIQVLWKLQGEGKVEEVANKRWRVVKGREKL